MKLVAWILLTLALLVSYDEFDSHLVDPLCVSRFITIGQFSAVLDHSGIVWNCWTGALAHPGLARAYAMQGDTAKAKTTYQDFLTLWKNADPDIPILIAARAEHAKLQ